MLPLPLENDMTAHEQEPTKAASNVGKMSQPKKPNLQSKDGVDIIVILDSLRSQSIGQYVNLPQLVVCGDQSSGKSSVLEAISGKTFPTRNALWI